MRNIKRHCIYTKDIMFLTGRSERYSRYLISKIKLHFGKQSHQFITPNEFAEYCGIEEDVIDKYLEVVS